MNILGLYSYLDRNGNGFDRFVNDIFRENEYGACAPQLNIVDLGAFQGEFGYYCLPFAKHVWAVEPDPEPMAKMAEIVGMFGLHDKFSLHSLAISGENGKSGYFIHI